MTGNFCGTDSWSPFLLVAKSPQDQDPGRHFEGTNHGAQATNPRRPVRGVSWHWGWSLGTSRTLPVPLGLCETSTVVVGEPTSMVRNPSFVGELVFFSQGSVQLQANSKSTRRISQTRRPTYLRANVPAYLRIYVPTHITYICTYTL